MSAIATLVEHRRLHVIKRARERLGLRLSQKDIATLEERLRAGQGESLRLNRDGSRVVRINFQFEPVIVAFDPRLDCILTVLPRHCREWKLRPSERKGEN